MTSHIQPEKTKIEYPDSKFFVNVRLYNTVKDLQRGTSSKDCAGVYQPNTVVIYPKRVIKPMLGTISLCKERLGCGLIAHEVFHASLDYANKKFNVGSLRTENSERQEDVAYFHGYMVKEIINWLNDNKLWK